MLLHPFAADTLTPTPWKNGGGITREVVIRPPGAGIDDFDWRASFATIASDGPFSVFPGVDRVIVLLAGDGVRLIGRDAGIDHRLERPLEPFAFAGEAAIDCTRLGGTSIDFNLMSRRDRVEATLEVLRADGPAAPVAGGEGLVYAVRGDWQVLGAGSGGPLGNEAAQPLPCPEGRGFWWAASAGTAPLVAVRASTADACLLRIAVRPRNAFP